MALDPSPRIPIAALALSLSGFFAITYLLCFVLSFFVPDFGNHALLQFFPRFSWTELGIHDGLIESLAYGWYIAIVFGGLFNFFVRRSESREVHDRNKGPVVSNV